jgi:glycosyltransferase involved in cell wall biosynthesis
MHTFLFYLALTTLLATIAMWTRMLTGMRSLDALENIEAPREFAWPRVSIIVPARNEEREIEEALTSLLALDYPDYEILVVNDRSTDRTGEILARMQTVYPQLEVVTVTELPSGWLGKNHALQFSADRASGELLLFTDADIIMQPSALRRGVYFLETEKLDHIAATPDVEMPGWLLESFVVIFVMMFTLFVKPWNVRNPKSKAHVGIGAFNLIRTSVYRAFDGHRPIAMRPDDDLKLGKLVKKNGYAQAMVSGRGYLLVRWYTSLRELIHGLEKNAFSGVDYSIGMILFSTFALSLVLIWPFLAVWIVPGVARWLYLATVILHLLAYMLVAKETRYSLRGVLAFPIIIGLFLYIQWRAMLLTYWRNGIRWRDTHYSLAELKANKV